jgi:hypothetical protein
MSDWDSGLAKMTCEPKKLPCTLYPPPLKFDKPGCFNLPAETVQICTEVSGVMYQTDQVISFPAATQGEISFAPITLPIPPTGAAASSYSGADFSPAYLWLRPCCAMAMPGGAQICPAPKYPVASDDIAEVGRRRAAQECNAVAVMDYGEPSIYTLLGGQN